jgi:quinoprotein glucose dehydrogenase
MPPHPILLDLTVDGEEIKAVIQFTKQAFAYVFNRETGEPVWPLIERPVATSDVPGEWTSPTQPFPTKPPAYDVQGIGVDDLIDFTPALREAAITAISRHRIGGIYTPPSLSHAEDGTRGMVVVPGFGGGANWEGGAADPETNFVYIGSHTSPSVIGLEPPEFGAFDSSYVMGGSLPLPTVDGLPIMKPPYSRITAYDMDRGEIAWVIANGDTPEEIANHPRLAGVDIPPTGVSSIPGLLVTGTLLIAGEGGDGHPLVHAYDKATGAELGRIAIPGGGPQQGSPMTYMVDGRQYIALFTANRGEDMPAQLVAYALPSAE